MNEKRHQLDWAQHDPHLWQPLRSLCVVGLGGFAQHMQNETCGTHSWKRAAISSAPHHLTATAINSNRALGHVHIPHATCTHVERSVTCIYLMPHAPTCHMPHATCHMHPRATCHMPHATCHVPHATCHVPRAKRAAMKGLARLRRVWKVGQYWAKLASARLRAGVDG